MQKEITFYDSINCILDFAIKDLNKAHKILKSNGDVNEFLKAVKSYKILSKSVYDLVKLKGINS